MKILLDAMGGDNSPDAAIKGAIRAANEIESEIVLIGKQDIIKQKISELNTEIPKNISIKNATEEIIMEDIPTEAIKHKKDSSMVVRI